MWPGTKEVFHCDRVLMYFLLLNILFYHFRNLLHHLPVYLCCWHQLWAFPFPAEPVQPAWWHWPWLWLVHVLRMGRPWPHPHRRLLLHLGSLRSANTPIHLPQVQTGERHRLLKLAAVRRLKKTEPTDWQQTGELFHCFIYPFITWLQFFICVCLKMGVLMICYFENNRKKSLRTKEILSEISSCAWFVVVGQMLKWTMTLKGCKGNLWIHWKTKCWIVSGYNKRKGT